MLTWEANTWICHQTVVEMLCWLISTDGLRGPLIVHDPAAPFANSYAVDV